MGAVRVREGNGATKLDRRRGETRVRGALPDRTGPASAPPPVDDHLREHHPTTGRLVQRVLSGGIADGRRFEAHVASADFARIGYYERPIVAHPGATAAANTTPNRPRFATAARRDDEILPLAIEVVAPRVVRLRFGPPPPLTDEILLHPEPPVLPMAGREVEGVWSLSAGEATITLDAEPFRLRIDVPGGPPFVLAHHDRNVFGQLITPPLAILDGADAGDEGDAGVGPRSTVAWAIGPAERLYGMGERFAAFDQRGRRPVAWATDAWGTTSQAAYKGCPIVCSSAGYAVFAHTSARVEADLGATSGAAAALTVADPGLDLFLFLGPDLKAVLGEYTALTGRMPMPPRWAFGVWASRCRYETRAEVEAVVDRMAAEEIPLDVVNLDPAWLKTPALNCDFVWDEEAFPDPAGMVRGLRERGVRVCLWEVPYLAAGTPLHGEARRRGFLLRGDDGDAVATIDGAFLPDLRRGLVDFTNPAAAAWWRDQHAPLLEMGIAAFKTDFGEAVPPDARGASGLDGARLRNLYPLLYNRAVWEATAAAAGEALVWGRSGWAGSQRYPAQWGGDPPTNAVGFAGCLRGGLNWALSAPGAWSHDIGGFAGPAPSPGLYVRWAQCGLLSPLARFHGTTPREPWCFGDEVLRIVRDYARLRSRLLPYLLSVAREAHRDGLPMLRPLVLEFPRDRGAWDVDDQYLLGPSLLVAPVVSDRIDPAPRTVYLPAGEWVDFWTGEIVAGGRFLDLMVPLDRLPLFLRRGTMLPMGPAMRHVDEVPTDPLTVRCAPAGTSSLELPEADGTVTRLTMDADGSGATFTIAGDVMRRYDLALEGLPAPVAATLDGCSLPVEAANGTARIGTPSIRSGELRVTW